MKKPTPRSLAAPTIVLYWLVLLGGLFVFTAVRDDNPKVADPLWFGALMGTVLGQAFAMRNLRLWFVVVLLAGIGIWLGPFTPPNQAGKHFWMAFVPATLCGYASLSERGALLAFWFPAVVWMLSILDGTAGMLALDSTAAALLGSLAILFVAFLYVREQRRVGLWRTIAPTPLAAPVAAKILKEAPKLQLGLTGWSLVASAAAFAIAAWLAPRLWHVEQLTPQLFASEVDAGPQRATGPVIRCRQRIELEQPRARVKEYFDLGRGHDDQTREVTQEEDLPFCDELLATGPQKYGYYDAYGRYHDLRRDGFYNQPTDPWDPWTGGAYNHQNGSPSYTPPAYTPPPAYERPEYERPKYERPKYERPKYERPKHERPKHERPKYERPKHERPKHERPKHERPQVAPKPEHERPKIARPEPKHEQPKYEPPKPPPAPMPTPEIATVPKPPPAPMPTPEIATAPKPAPAPAPPAIAPVPPAPPQATTAKAAAAPDLPMLAWLVIALAGAVGFQLFLLGLRPVRRALTLRHIRKPFWNETIDQRISNWWHLVLVGLRDAGWRTGAGEGPRELAKRTNIDGVEQAAAILDRARHGVGLDPSDLADMREAAETAYARSRQRATPFARFLGWFRRPLA